MKHWLRTLMISLILSAGAQTAHAEDVAECELLLVQVIQIEENAKEAQIASYRSAEDFMKSVTDDVPGHMTQVDGLDIRALMCRRNEVIPTKSDYAVMSTGIPFILSQDFDSPDTDSLTMYWKEGKIEHVYKGYPLSKEAEAILEKRLADFSERGLSSSAHEAAKIKAEIEAKMKARLEKEQAAEVESTNAVDTPDIVDLTNTKIAEDVEQDEISDEETQNIESLDDETSDSTKLNVQTQNESAE